MILPGPHPFSKRTGWDRASNALSACLAAKKSSGQKVLDLTESNPTRCGFKFHQTSLLAPLSDPKVLLYEPDARGLLSARQAICDYYAEKRIGVLPEQVFLTSGTSEAYQFLFHLLADAGDGIFCAKPSYPLLATLAGLNDVALQNYSLVYDDGWHIDLASFAVGAHSCAPLQRQHPRAVLVIHPNNPTGNFVSSGERKTLNAFCQKNGSALIADEVFLDFAWDPKEPVESFASNQETLTFTLGGVSKLLALPQMKLSWIVVTGPENLKREAMERLEVIADAMLSVNTPSQRALPVWLEKKNGIRQEILTRVRANAAALNQAAQKSGRGTVLKSRGGWVAVLSLKGSVTDEATALEWLEKKNVLVHPGYLYDFAAEDKLVFSLLAEEAVFSEGVGRAFSS